MRDLDNNEFQDAVVFRGTPVVSAAMTVFFFGMLLLSAVMFKNLSVYIQVLSIVGIPIILWGTMRWVRIVCRGKQVILAIGKRGIFDWRLSDAWIPWTAIAAITKTNEAAGYKNVVPRNFRGVVIQLDSTFIATLPRKSLARITLALNGWTGTPGIPIGLLGTDASFQQFTDAFDKYFPQWRQLSVGSLRNE